MSIWNERKIDCHTHVLDPARFAYEPDTLYRPTGQEIAPLHQLMQVHDAYGVDHALLVGPNSGYGSDNRCLLDALRRGAGRYKGIAVVPSDISRDALSELKSQGVVGVAFNLSVWGTTYYLNAGSLLDKLAELDMFLQIQTEKDQLLSLLPLLERSAVKLLLDHCGRPVVEEGVGQPGFQAALALGRSGRASVKLSGYIKFSNQPHPHADTRPFVDALVAAFGLDGCMWGSDWPYLKAPERVDFGPLLKLAESLFPDPAERDTVLWKTPQRLFGFPGG